MICALLSALKTNSVPVRLYFSLFTNSADSYYSWGDDLIQQLQQDGREGTIEWNQSTFFSDNSTLPGDEQNYISTKIGAQELDLIISTDSLYNYLLDMDCILSLNDVIDFSKLASWPDALITMNDGTITALKLSAEQFPEAANDDYYLYAFSYSSHLDDIKQMIELIIKSS